MRIVFWGKGERGAACLRALSERGYAIPLVVTQSEADTCATVALARRLGLRVCAPADPNKPDFVDQLRSRKADVFALCGYGLILREPAIRAATRLCLNLHAGAVPQRRGSSPLNWALLEGASKFSLSILEVDSGVDSGPVLLERSFPIGPNETIADLHRVANEHFPRMLCDTLDALANKMLRREPQNGPTRYYPVRFPDDGFVLFDALTASQVHNRVRALAPPYPGAFSFYEDRRIVLLTSRIAEEDVRGEPGRVYRVNRHGALVAASDRCVWIVAARFADDNSDAMPHLRRYTEFATLRGAALRAYAGSENTLAHSLT
ncbi:MAG: methionyl-tRNA formyltransferase [Phycisphaerales bacterium]|nr:methionyl-tRNA formyltransferase [Phycisphaerales bacterium]